MRAEKAQEIEQYQTAVHQSDGLSTLQAGRGGHIVALSAPPLGPRANLIPFIRGQELAVALNRYLWFRMSAISEFPQFEFMQGLGLCLWYRRAR